MKAVDGASGIKGEHVKPIDFSQRGDCPCDAFLRCSTRPPYGQDVWSNIRTREQARGAIAYDSEAPVTNLDKYVEIFKAMEKNSKWKYKNSFYKNVRCLSDKARKVMTFPPMTVREILIKMAAHRSLIFNTGSYTLFQKSMILRANIVKNGMELRSDVYADESGAVLYDSKKLTPFYRKPEGLEWNVDHIQTRSKGACNRFCNAAVLARDDNMSKKDDWQGCPCVDALGRGESKLDCQEAFQYTGNAGKFTLVNCGIFSLNKEKKEKGDDVQKLPAAPLGTIDKYRQLCRLDNPLRFDPNSSSELTKNAEQICDSGQ